MMALTLANVGTAMVWLGLLHLVVLNAVLGIIEGLMLARWGRVPRPRVVLILIAANYASAWIGLQFMRDLGAWAKASSGEGPLLYHVEWALAIMVAATFAMTVVLEMPLGLWVLRRSTRPRWARAMAVVVVNVVTYAGLGGVYLLASGVSVLKYERVRDAGVIAGDTAGWVYYVGPDRRTLRRVRLDGSRRETVGASEELAAVAAREGMWTRKGADGTVEVCTLGSGTPDFDVTVTRLEGLSVIDASEGAWNGVLANRMYAVDFRAPGNKTTSVIALYGPGYGLRESRRSTDRKDAPVRIVQLDTPFFRWDAQFPTVLPNGEIVLEFDAHIMVMDDRRIGVLVEGVSPVVVLDAAE